MTNAQKHQEKIKRQIQRNRIIIAALVALLIVAILLICANANGCVELSECTILCVVIGILSSVGLFFACLDYYFKKNTYRYLKNLPYDFYYVEELHQYNYIGVYNRGKEEGYNKYSEWKKHIEESYRNQLEDVNTRNNFSRFLVRILREKKNEKKLYETLMIPIDVAFLALYFESPEPISYYSRLIAMVSCVLLLVIFASSMIIYVSKEISFIEDFLEIVNEKQCGKEWLKYGTCKRM